jgi:hypothetical protein
MIETTEKLQARLFISIFVANFPNEDVNFFGFPNRDSE